VPAIMTKGLEGALVAGPLLALLVFIHIGDALLTRAKAKTGLHSKDGNLPTGEKGDSPLFERVNSADG